MEQQNLFVIFVIKVMNGGKAILQMKIIFNIVNNLWAAFKFKSSVIYAIIRELKK